MKMSIFFFPECQLLMMLTNASIFHMYVLIRYARRILMSDRAPRRALELFPFRAGIGQRYGRLESIARLKIAVQSFLFVPSLNDE